MENYYFDVPKILGGQKPGVEIIGSSSTPLNPPRWRPDVDRHLPRSDWLRESTETAAIADRGR